MNFEEKVRFLKQYNYCYESLKSLFEERERWFTIATKVNSVSDGMPHSHSVSSKVENSSIRMVELTEMINVQVERMTALRDEIETAIEALEDLDQRSVLKFMYINDFPAEKIAEIMSMSERNVYFIRKRAIENLCVR